jgi:hypothetical protein
MSYFLVSQRVVYTKPRNRKLISCIIFALHYSLLPLPGKLFCTDLMQALKSGYRMASCWFSLQTQRQTSKHSAKWSVIFRLNLKTQNYCFLLCLSCGVLKLETPMFLKLDLLLSSGKEGKTPTLLGPLERANLNHWTVPVRVRVTRTLRLAIYHHQYFFFNWTLSVIVLT